MTREEAARVLKYLWIERDENAKSMQQLTKSFFERQEALRIGVAALRGSEPDPDTGLVPCGCGGKAKEETRIGEISGDYISRVFCEECGIATEYYSDGNVTFLDWNRAMGRKLQ